MGPTGGNTSPTIAPQSYKSASNYIWQTDSTAGQLTLPTAATTVWTNEYNVTLDSSNTYDSWLDNTPTGTGATADNQITWAGWHWVSDPGVPNGQFWITSGHSSIVADPKMLKKAEMARRRQALLPSAKATRFGLPKTDNFAELKARQLLKSFIGGERFRRYLKDGFISVTSPVTGLVYQIFPGHQSVVVRDKGKRTASCCIVFRDTSLPPTDWVIMRMSLIMADETTFYEKANVSGQIPEQLRRAA